MQGTNVDVDGDASHQLLTVAEVAESFRVSTMTVYRLIQSGELPAFRVGKSYRISVEGMRSYLASGQVQVSPAQVQGEDASG